MIIILIKFTLEKNIDLLKKWLRHDDYFDDIPLDMIKLKETIFRLY